ncbi:hypothetical protein SAMN04489740_1066 [Arthrobacter alpinus]|uniref:Uncharacterized protein n=1 Tax=Arthrobacter alpinus TaxID=656366 RepID=A0A1H5HNG2_9MICC|nr:hypothetical protein [Arthrobacter alpinus]SEE29529.1 hypothetical protein SAMN04489740_1066 [Arthrobacter alpinus]
MDTKEQLNQSAKFLADLPSICCLLLGLGVVTALFNGWILVIGSHVVRTWIVSCVILVASLVLLWVRAKRRRSDSANGGIWGWTRPIVTFLLVAAVGVGSSMGAFADMGMHNFMLDPRGQDGCQLVVRESAFLMAGGGEVYTVGTAGIGQLAGAWSTDDGYRPIEAGSYTLDWDSNVGELTVHEAFNFRSRQENTPQHTVEFGGVAFSGTTGAGRVEQQQIKCR